MDAQKTYDIITKPDGSKWVEINRGQEVKILSQVPPGINKGNFLLGEYQGIKYALNYEPVNNRRPNNNKKRRGDCHAPAGATQTDSRPPDNPLVPIQLYYFAIYCNDTGNPGELLIISENTITTIKNRYRPHGNINKWDYFAMDFRPDTYGEILDSMITSILDNVWT